METRFSILCIAVNEYHTYKLFCEMYLNKIDKLFYYWINHQRRFTFFNKCILFDYLVIILATTLILFEPVFCEKHFLYHNHKLNVRVFYQPGIKSKSQLPKCDPWTVCSKVNTYSMPWIERHCQCPGNQECSNSLNHNDGHSLGDQIKQYKICESVNDLPECELFKDVTWTLTSNHDNTTSQRVNCVCPKNSVAYIFKHQLLKTEQGFAYKYYFACSPESKSKCQRKEPCRLFTVRKRKDVEEVNTNTLCQCPRGYKCPTHHNELSVIPGTVYPLDHIRTYSGYCSKEFKFFDNKLYKGFVTEKNRNINMP